MIGIIGHGVVGKAASNTLKNYFELVIYDKYLESVSFSNLHACDFIFVIVPTPFDASNMQVDMSAVQESLDRLESINYSGIVIIKSTIPPGSTLIYEKRYNYDIVFNPEFLRESTTPNEDFANQDIVVLGTNDFSVYTECKNMYSKVLKENVDYFHVDATTAEMIKYSQNTMLASRVALANMIYDACADLNVDYDTVKSIAFDSFEILGPHMSQVPGPDGKRGFGGKCLPKDSSAFNSIFKSDLLSCILKYNSKVRDDLGNFLENYDKNTFLKNLENE